MTGLTFKLYGGPGMRWLGETTHYGAAIEQARRLTMWYSVRMEVWATDTGGRGVPVHLVYQCG